MIFHFQFDGDRGWEAMGAAEGLGSDPLPGAIEDLRVLHGGALPAGDYQYIAAAGRGSRWRRFELGEEGDLLR